MESLLTSEIRREDEGGPCKTEEGKEDNREGNDPGEEEEEVAREKEQEGEEEGEAKRRQNEEEEEMGNEKEFEICVRAEVPIVEEQEEPEENGGYLFWWLRCTFDSPWQQTEFIFVRPRNLTFNQWMSLVEGKEGLVDPQDDSAIDLRREEEDGSLWVVFERGGELTSTTALTTSIPHKLFRGPLLEAINEANTTLRCRFRRETESIEDVEKLVAKCFAPTGQIQNKQEEEEEEEEEEASEDVLTPDDFDFIEQLVGLRPAVVN